MGISITLILIIMTGLISYQAFSDQAMKNKLLFHPKTVKDDGQYYRFLTNGFVHADMTHLAVNMFVLYMFGEQIENLFDGIFGAPFGRFYYLALYLGSIIFGAMPSFFKHQGNAYYAALGASGGTSGIVLAYCIFDPWAILLLMFIIPCPAVIAAVLYLAYSTWASKNSNDNIAHDAHLFGAIFGFVFTVALLFLLRADVLPILWQQLIAGPSF